MKALEYFEQRSAKDEATGCWLWSLCTSGHGYGQFLEDGRQKGAHRGAWEAVNGQIPKGACVLHKCDVPRCCNPAHLSIGTTAENSRDMVLKGRQAKGARNGSAKLTEHDVGIIKTLLGLGVRQQRLATLYGVAQNNISRLKLGRLWPHVVSTGG